MKRKLNPIYVVIICSLSLVLLTIVALLLMGYRITSDNGIKFIGKVVEGQPMQGSLNYPGDNDGDLDKLNNTITFEITGEMPSSCTHDCSTCGGGCSH